MAKYEAHLTFDQSHAAIVEAAGEVHGWAYSVIAGCPLLGQGTYCYLTAYAMDPLALLIFLRDTDMYCREQGAAPLRSKIERIVYDTRTGVNEIEKSTHSDR